MEPRHPAKPHLDVQTLRYFLAFVQEGTTLAAARTMHISQPSLSRQIANLEKNLGAPLYTREGRHIKLTERGRALQRYAESVIELMDKMESELLEPAQRVAGYVYIGHGEPVSMHTVMRAMVLARTRYPDVRFHLFTGSSSDLFDKLETGMLDFLVEGEAVPRAGYGRMALPGTDRWGIVVHEDDPLAARRAVAPEDMEGKAVLCSRQVIKAGVLRAWAGSGFDKMDVVATFNAGSYILSLAARHRMAYVFTYEDIYKENMPGNLRFIPLDPPAESESGLAWKRDRPRSAAAQAFFACMEEVVREGAAPA